MTTKERFAASLSEFAKQWEDGKTIYALSKETRCSTETIRMLFTAHFGEERYKQIAFEHRQKNCFSKGVRFQPGNAMYKRRKRVAGNDKFPVGSITTWSFRGHPRRYIRTSLDRKGWRPVSQVIWEKLHGPIPKGHIVVYIDGDNMNDDPSNYRLVSRAEMARNALNRCDNRKRIAKIAETVMRKTLAKKIAAERTRKLLAMREKAA